MCRGNARLAWPQGDAESSAVLLQGGGGREAAAKKGSMAGLLHQGQREGRGFSWELSGEKASPRCGVRKGISRAPGSALWLLLTLFGMASLCCALVWGH